jgi:hypothetical protein
MTVGAFFLYLRSFGGDFETTETWAVKNAGESAEHELRRTPKGLLEFLLEEAGPLIEIGKSGKGGIALREATMLPFLMIDFALGRSLSHTYYTLNRGLDDLSSHQLGRVRVSDNEWWDRAMELIIHSTAIFISVDDTKSLIKEIELIFSDNRLLRRAFLIMEPGDGSMVFRDCDCEAVKDRRERWERTRAFFRERGSDLPEYREAGMIVSLYDPGKHTAFSGLSRYGLYDLLQPMAVDLTKRGSYDILKSVEFSVSFVI